MEDRTVSLELCFSGKTEKSPKFKACYACREGYVFIHPLFPRVTQSGCNPTSCSLQPEPTQSAVPGNHTCVCVHAHTHTHARLKSTCTETGAILFLFPPLPYSSRLQRPRAAPGGLTQIHLTILSKPCLPHSLGCLWRSMWIQGGPRPQAAVQAAHSHSRGHRPRAIDAC